MRELIPNWIKRLVIRERGQICGICQQPIQWGQPAEFDHIYPVSKGGSNVISNIHYVHKKCNRKKGANIVMNSAEQWRKWWEQIEPNLTLDKLRDNQADALQNTIERLNHPDPDYQIRIGGKPKIYCECTGAGKSVLMLLVGMMLARKRILIVTPSRVIKKNNFDALDDAVKLGIIPDHVRREIHQSTLDSSLAEQYLPHLHIAITTFQKLGKKDKDRILANIPPDMFDVVLIDEGHHYREHDEDEEDTTTHVDIVNIFKNHAKILLFTATPFNAALNPLLKDYNKERDLIHEFNYSDAWKKGYVKYFEWSEVNPEDQTLKINYPDGTSTKLTLNYEEVKARLKNNKHEYKNAVVKSTAIQESLLQATIKLLDKRNQDLRNIAPKNIALIVCSNIELAKECSKLLDMIGTRYKHCIIHSKDPNVKQTLQDIQKNVYDIIISVAMVKEGFNQKNITIVTLIRAIESYVMFSQVIGRGVRSRRDISGKPIPVSGPVQERKDICFIVTHESYELTRLWDQFREFDLQALKEPEAMPYDFMPMGEGSGDAKPPLLTPNIQITNERVKGFGSAGFYGDLPVDETDAHYFKVGLENDKSPQLQKLKEVVSQLDTKVLAPVFQLKRSKEYADTRNVSTTVTETVSTDNENIDFASKLEAIADNLRKILQGHLRHCIKRGVSINIGLAYTILSVTFKQVYDHPLKARDNKTGYRVSKEDVDWMLKNGPQLIREYYGNIGQFKSMLLPTFKTLWEQETHQNASWYFS